MTRYRKTAFAAFAMLCLARAASAQSLAAPLATLPQLAALPAGSASELTIGWNVLSSPTADPVPAAAAGVPQNDFRMTARRSVAEMPVRQRDPQLSEDDLVIVAVNAQGADVGWQLVKDPSVVRAEAPTASGELRGQVLRRPQTSFVVTVPQASPAIAVLRVYKPRWTGSGFALDALGTVTIPATAQ